MSVCGVLSNNKPCRPLVTFLHDLLEGSLITYVDNSAANLCLSVLSASQNF